MLIDIHLHTSEFSTCSRMRFEDAVHKAKSLGLDGICITDHHSKGIARFAKHAARDNELLIIVGVEILTYEGDILVFGLEDFPRHMMHAQELIDYVNERNGVTISAHPFRDNDRGLRDNIAKVHGLTGVEAYNGNTTLLHNEQAYNLAQAVRLPLLGGSDAHKLEQVGCYATLFKKTIISEQDLVNEIRLGNVQPVVFNSANNSYQVITPLSV